MHVETGVQKRVQNVGTLNVVFDPKKVRVSGGQDGGLENDRL